MGHGGGTYSQHAYCTPIAWSEAQPADSVFYPVDSHVGIVGGRDESGSLLIIHCASGYNNVVITGIEGFNFHRQARVFHKIAKAPLTGAFALYKRKEIAMCKYCRRCLPCC